MKIQEQIRLNFGEQRPVNNEPVSSISEPFQKIMQTYSKELTKDHLQELMTNIDEQGLKLSKSPTFTELRKYKDLVKRFMGEVTKNGIGLAQTESWDLYGGNKTLKTIQTLDRKLMELTHHVLNQQSEGLTILDRIGEIKGLLINLYT